MDVQSPIKELAEDQTPQLDLDDSARYIEVDCQPNHKEFEKARDSIKPFTHTDLFDSIKKSKTPTYATSNLKAIKGLFAFEDSDSGETPQKKLSKNTQEKKRITIKDLDKRYDKK